MVVVGGMGTKKHYVYVFERHQIRKAVGKFAISKAVGEQAVFYFQVREPSGNSPLSKEVGEQAFFIFK